MDTLIADVPSVAEAEIARHYGTEIGHGAFRRVYRVPGSSWAYKFNRRDSECYFADRDANSSEFRNYSAMRESLPEGIDFPEMVLLENGAIAVRFIEGVSGYDSHDYNKPCVCDSHGLSECWRDLVCRVNIRDLHGNNVRICKRDGKLYIIDIGEFGV